MSSPLPFHPKLSGDSPLRFQAPKGTFDILPEEQPYRRFFESRAEEIAASFGYGRIDTPMFEDARLFIRGVGEVTDVIEKETYTFEDRGGDLITLRPEGTAPVCRAYLEHGMHNLPQPVRLYYLITNFRYERPQAGRYRQHHQLGIEVFGDEDPAIDAEVIEVGWRVLDAVGIGGKTLALNSIGDPECRPGYVEKLQAHYRPQADEVCHDCRRRMDQNPLRLLDCKQDSCQSVIAGAPHSTDYLCAACLEHWEALLQYLRDLGLPFRTDHRLVRGFDYYTRTVFEIVPARRWQPEHDGGRRPVRRADRGAGRRAHAGHRLRHGHRARHPERQEPGRGSSRRQEDEGRAGPTLGRPPRGTRPEWRRGCVWPVLRPSSPRAAAYAAR